MCGICGVCFNDPKSKAPEDLLRRMTTALRHRGPDGDGFLVRQNIGLGHRRLSIIDLAGGDQPIFNEDGRIGIVFNGEIYNYVELAEELKAAGHRFRTHSDTEVIVHLYEEMGDTCVERLRGMFTFAIWDGRDGSVLLARDRLGIKPLFYSPQPDRFLFASEMKSILEDPAIARKVNLSALREYLALGYVPGDTCILNGVSKLSPGHVLRWQNGTFRIEKFWDVEFPAPVHKPGDDSSREAEHVLREAVRIHMRSDVPVGVLLSGGVDSAAMVALASVETNTPLKTFSIGFEEKDYCELAFARQTATRYNTEHHEIIVKDHDLSVLPQVVWHLDEPFADPSSVPTYYVCREAAKHVKVCLSGDGSDEIFGGYTRYRKAMNYKYVDWAPIGLRRSVASFANLLPHVMWGKGLLGRIGAEGVERYLQTVGIFHPSECNTILGHVPQEPALPLTRYLAPYFSNPGQNVLATLQHTDQKTYLPDDILVKVDRMSMQNSLEIRPPFLDHVVVEFANRCSADMKIRKGVSKAVLKDLMRKYIPSSVIDRKKTGFGMPIKHWFRNGMQHTARELLLGRDARSAAFFDPAEVERVVSGHQYGARDLSERIWSLLVFEQWCRTLKI